MNTIAADYNFSDEGICSNCKGYVTEQGHFIHDEGCDENRNLYESDLDNDQDNRDSQNMSSTNYGGRFGVNPNKLGYFDDSLSGDEIEPNEQEVERQVEEFRKRLESCFKDSAVGGGAQTKRKIKPNITADWIVSLRQRLKSGSTQENSSNERYEKSPGKENNISN